MSSAKGLVHQQSKRYDKWRSCIRWKTMVLVALRNQPLNPVVDHHFPHEDTLNPLLFVFLLWISAVGTYPMKITAQIRYSSHENGHKLGLWTLIVRSKRSAICTCAVVAGFEAAAPPRSRQKVGSWYRLYLVIFIFSNWLYIILHMIYDIWYMLYYILYIILYYIMLCYIILYSVIWYYIISYHIILYCTIQYNTINTI